MAPPIIWIPSIIDRIARFLPRNEVACSLRVVDKATAAVLRTPEFTTVRLSEPVPHHAFAWRWVRPGTMRELTLVRRRALTAASGATDNLALAARAAGCPLTDEVSYAAGKAGQLGSCALLAELGCDMAEALLGAAAGGHLEELTSWAGLEHQYHPVRCAAASAEAGHTHILEPMVQRCKELRLLYPRRTNAWKLLRSVAEGCDLAALQRYLVQLVAPDGVEDVDDEEWSEEENWVQMSVVAAAAGSPTPDWRAKLEWLKSQDFPRTWEVYTAAAKRPDALERFAWLAQQGYPSLPEDGYDDDGADAPLEAAATAGNTAAVLFLAEGWPAGEDLRGAWCTAADEGHLHVLQALHAAGRGIDARVAARAAARRGHLRILAWLVETPGLGLTLDERLLEAAATSGSVELMAWLRERGCPWDSQTFTAAAESGCEAALEWLAERGCPMPWMRLIR
ncbi:hypothetical protein GPECTOR_69g435 [Gonium pectorale]|uniref:Uncharacterized protein n=1 Tax=Gonium pectorale TaxID=33097 RepID=A0A150G390_GONPE|nr:hypothetical protein GPECTOR_69g435 [Gonium pectorale]|eukprot:KXZ44342.1 hypothetical protein GPECTOR_69g435 [Gonium pectorale]